MLGTLVAGMGEGRAVEADPVATDDARAPVSTSAAHWTTLRARRAMSGAFAQRNNADPHPHAQRTAPSLNDIISLRNVPRLETSGKDLEQAATPAKASFLPSPHPTLPYQTLLPLWNAKGHRTNLLQPARCCGRTVSPYPDPLG